MKKSKLKSNLEMIIIILCFLLIFINCDSDKYLHLEKNVETLKSKEISYAKSKLIKFSKSKGTYENFLDTLRAFESDISLSKVAYYEENYNNPKAVSYPDVEFPGRVIRDVNGNPIYSTTSIKGFFIKLGINDIYVLGSRDLEMFKKMQFSVINFIGFVGYQFSEQDLWVLGYYTRYDKNGLKEYYSDLPNSTWSNGVRDTIINNIHITDVNTWQGNFTGKHGIKTFEDFKNPTLQQYIALDHFKYKYDMIVKTLGERGKTIEEYLGTKLYWDKCIPKISPPPGGRNNEVIVTMSGLLAGAHLRGAAGVASLLIDHKNNKDEIGTTILQYVQDYGEYDTPFGSEN